MGIIQSRAKNILINGAFDFWQRGITFNGAANALYTADRWVNGKAGTLFSDVDRSTDVPLNNLSQYSVKFIPDVLEPVLAAGSYHYFSQRIEGYNFAPLADRWITVSFMVKSNKIGTYCVSFANSTGSHSIVKEYTINSSDTWELKVFTFKHDSTIGTWLFQEDIGMRVRFCYASGTTFQTTADSWQAGNFLATSNQTNLFDNGANYLNMTQVMVNAGKGTSRFERAGYNITNEEDLCLRYYEIAGSNIYAAQTTSYLYWWFKVNKRVIPVLSGSAYGTTSASVRKHNVEFYRVGDFAGWLNGTVDAEL